MKLQQMLLHYLRRYGTLHCKRSMHARLVEAGRKDDPYRASLPDNYKDRKSCDTRKTGSWNKTRSEPKQSGSRDTKPLPVKQVNAED